MAMEMKVDTKRIRALREERAWSQEHLAAVAGLSARTVQRLEAEGSASAESRMAIAAAFGIAPAALLPGPDQAGSRAELGCEALPAATQAPRAYDLTKIAQWALLLVVLLVVAGYTIGKDAAIRDNARCEKDLASCQR